MTGLSGSGKSTIANQLELFFESWGIKSYVLDGDNIRTGLNKDLGFSNEDRNENIRRISEVSKLFSDSGTITITAFISPFEKEREEAKKIIGEENFTEVFINTSLEVCEKRDVKGLYKKARAGEIKNFTGIDSPYEEPKNPDLIINAGTNSIDKCAEKIFRYVEKRMSKINV